MNALFDRSHMFIITGLTILIAGILIGSLIAISRTEGPVITAPAMSQASSPKQKITSVRIDLSSMEENQNAENEIRAMFSKLERAGAKAVFLSPWQDGKANYKSTLMRQSARGQQGFVESFIRQAHEKNIQVYAWFVNGKDTFDAKVHPEWFAKTVEGKNYYHNDEPGVYIAMASLAHPGYIEHHLKALAEASKLPFDGWVISEPLASWSEKDESTYADFSSFALRTFIKDANVDPRNLFNEQSSYYYKKNPSLYAAWVNTRANIVTEFVQKSISEIRSRSNKPIGITVYTEPDTEGSVVPSDVMKEWLGEDIPALASLKPDFIEIQYLFNEFENKQKPEDVKKMVESFKQELAKNDKNIPLMVSVQGFSGEKPLSLDAFRTALQSAMATDVLGVSFYAYHTLDDAKWEAVRSVWTRSTAAKDSPTGQTTFQK